VELEEFEKVSRVYRAVSKNQCGLSIDLHATKLRHLGPNGRCRVHRIIFFISFFGMYGQQCPCETCHRKINVPQYPPLYNNVLLLGKLYNNILFSRQQCPSTVPCFDLSDLVQCFYSCCIFTSVRWYLVGVIESVRWGYVRQELTNFFFVLF
jgi:hypothetical protein